MTTPQRILSTLLCLTLWLSLCTGCATKPSPPQVVAAPYPVLLSPPAHLLAPREIPPLPKGKLTPRKLAKWVAEVLVVLGQSEGDKAAARKWIKQAQEGNQ